MGSRKDQDRSPQELVGGQYVAMALFESAERIGGSELVGVVFMAAAQDTSYPHPDWIAVMETYRLGESKRIMDAAFAMSEEARAASPEGNVSSTLLRKVGRLVTRRPLS